MDDNIDFSVVSYLPVNKNEQEINTTVKSETKLENNEDRLITEITPYLNFKKYNQYSSLGGMTYLHSIFIQN